MGLAEQQAALAKLYTDGTARKAFYADARAAGRSWGLSDSDIDEIVLVPRKQIEGFARSLVVKRRGEVEKFLPTTCRFLGPDFIPLFHRHAGIFLPLGSQRHREDALVFAGSISAGDLSSECAEYVRDIARFERALLIARTGRRPRFCLFRHDVRLAMRSESSGGADAPLAPTLVLVLIWPARWGRVRVSGLRLK